MAYLNIITVTGYLGSDPEIKYFESGKQVCKVQVASKPPYKTENTQWLPVELWNNDSVVNYMQKGGQVAMSGELKIDRWSDSSGNQRSKPVLNASDIRLLSKPKEASEVNDENY